MAPQQKRDSIIGANERSYFELLLVIQISDVDVANQTFKCYLRCYLDWPATLEECKQFWMRDQDAYSVISMGDNTAAGSFFSFQPWTKFFVVSQESSVARDWAAPDLCWVDKHERYFIRTNAEFRCTCVRKFDLERFPFDIQDLTITFQLGTGSRAAKWAQLVPIHSRPVICKVLRKHSVLDEYIFDEDNVFTFFQNSDPTDSSVYCSTSNFRIIIKLQRIWQSYFSRTGGILSMIALACNMVFAIDDESISDRLSFLGIMLLSAVAFMFIIYTHLTILPYLTYLDYYSNAQFLYMLSLMIAACASERQDDDDLNLPQITSIAVWIGYHLILIVWFYNGAQTEKKKLQFKANDYCSVAQKFSTITRPNISKNWFFGHRYPGAKKDDLIKGPRRFLEGVKHKYCKKDKITLGWNYDSRLTEENLDSEFTTE